MKLCLMTHILLNFLSSYYFHKVFAQYKQGFSFSNGTLLRVTKLLSLRLVKQPDAYIILIFRLTGTT